MGIQSIIGNVSSAVGQNMASILETALGVANGVTSGIGTFVANVYDGGFAGVSDFEALKAAIGKYSDGVQEIVDTYDANADLDQTFKGQVGDAASEFVASTKLLLEAWASIVRNWNVQLEEVYRLYNSEADRISSDVISDAEAVKQAAESIRID